MIAPPLPSKSAHARAPTDALTIRRTPSPLSRRPGRLETHIAQVRNGAEALLARPRLPRGRDGPFLAAGSALVSLPNLWDGGGGSEVTEVLRRLGPASRTPRHTRARRRTHRRTRVCESRRIFLTEGLTTPPRPPPCALALCGPAPLTPPPHTHTHTHTAVPPLLPPCALLRSPDQPRGAREKGDSRVPPGARPFAQFARASGHRACAARAPLFRARRFLAARRIRARGFRRPPPRAALISARAKRAERARGVRSRNRERARTKSGRSVPQRATSGPRRARGVEISPARGGERWGGDN